MTRSLIICSKSSWLPAIRREHAWAQLAAERGHRVTFIERPADVRTLREPGRRRWGRGLLPSGRRGMAGPGLVVHARSTFVPGHHSAAAECVNTALLTASIRAAEPDGGADAVCCVPWDWAAVARAPLRRRVFDLADDWAALIPNRKAHFEDTYRRISAEADAVIVVNDEMRRHFPGRDVVVARNGVSATMLTPPTGDPVPRTMMYLGTLTPRFDVELVAAVLGALGDWRLELVGPCLYPGSGALPGPELDALLTADDRVRWHGPLPRADVVPMLDAAAVLTLPNRPLHSLGQDSMKLYDYAARGRPIVTTRWHPQIEQLGPPHLRVAGTAAEFLAAVRSAADEPAGAAAARRDWAAQQRWESRWPTWSEAVFGAGS